MAGRPENSIISEGALQPLDSSPGPTRPGRTTNPMAAQPMPPPPVSAVDILQSKFDELGDDEDDFTDAIVEENYPSDWGEINDVFDENGLNILHYSILKCYSNAVTVLLEDLDFDVNVKTRINNKTPLQLALEKCCDCIIREADYKQFFGIIQILMKSTKAAIGADESVLRLAVNFPVILKNILAHHPEFYQHRPGILSPLTNALNLGLIGYTHDKGIFELLLEKNVEDVVNILIDKDPDYVKTFVSTGGETPLHTVAKLGNVEIVRRLMESRLGEHMYNKPDRRHYTPIITAMVHYHDHKEKEHKEKSLRVITEILSYLSTFNDNYAACIGAIKQLYNGLPVIEHDIRSGEAVIVQAIMMLDKDPCKKILCSHSYSLGTIFHLAARYGLSLKFFKVDNDEKFDTDFLGSKDETDGSKPDKGSSKPWPCDYAVQYDHVDFLEEAWRAGREEWSHEIETACRFGNLHAFIFLASRTKNALTEIDYRNLLLLACQHGQACIVKYFLETVKVSPHRYSPPQSSSDRFSPDRENKNKLPTALMRAADSDAVDCVKLLLDHNASVTDVDANGYTALCRAILIGKKKAVMAILTHPNHGERALRFCTQLPESKKPNITPMRLLVEHMPDVARWVLNNQIIYESSTGKITYRYDLIDDFDPDNCDFSGPLTCLLCRNKPLRQSVDQVDSLPLVAGNPQYNSLNDNDSNRSGTYHQKPTKYDSKNHMLNLMVRSKSLDILDHLLVGKVIDYYWRYVIWEWIVLRSVYLFITVMLTAFTLVLPHPNETICRGDEEISGGRRVFLIFSSIVLILSALLALFISGFTLYAANLTVFSQTRFRVLFEAILPFLIFLFVIGYGNEDWCAQNWQWNVGAFCTCLSWFSLLVTLKGFRLTASPINMLFAIIKRFLLIIYVPILLIAAFALPFYMLFNEPLQSFGPYRDIGATLGTLTILFTGDGDYGDRFNSDAKVDFPFASYFMYFLFVIVVGILFNNLLVSLAVGEVGELQENAKLEQHRLNVEGIIDGLEIFFSFIQPLKPDSFALPDHATDDEYQKDYFEAENEWKKAQAENMEFVNQILEEESGEVIQRKIDQLEATLLQKIKSLQQQIQELADK